MNHVLKSTWAKLAKHLPGRTAERWEDFPLNPIRLVERLEVGNAVRSGPPYRPSHRRIIIDITSSCDLHCRDCNRSCGERQAPANEHMSVVQIENFVKESVEQRRLWKEIALEGGEPTLHPQLNDIVALLLKYQRTSSRRTNIRLSTNGYREQSRPLLDSLRRRGILVVNTRKQSSFQQHHCAFNIAPCDVPEFAGVEFSHGCYLPACYGLGLTRYGYYPHPICGGIDRVFGLDIGRKRLPDSSDDMQDQFTRLCGLCGFFRPIFLSRADDAIGRVSRTWELAYARYKEARPVLKPY